MLILSQDKEKILNFDNISKIFVNEGGNTVSVYDNAGEYSTIGCFSSKEKAKTVLLDILNFYSAYESLDIASNANNTVALSVVMEELNLSYSDYHTRCYEVPQDCDVEVKESED